MSAEQNKATVLRVFEEGINQNRPEVFDEVIAPDYVNHSMPAPVPGVAGMKQVIGMFLAAFPDMHIEIADAIAEGDRVVTRGVMRGTHRGEFNGIPATGRQVAVDYIDVWRLQNGKGRDNWVQIDILGLMQQLGAIPAPAGATA